MATAGLTWQRLDAAAEKALERLEKEAFFSDSAYTGIAVTAAKLFLKHLKEELR